MRTDEVLIPEGKTEKNPASQMRILNRGQDRFDIERPVFRDRLKWSRTHKFYGLDDLIDFFENPEDRKMILREFL